METFIAVCLAVLTLTHLCALVLFVATLMQLRRAAQAFEVLAYQAQDEMERMGSATRRVADFASLLSTPWLRTAALGIGAIFALWPKGKKSS